MTQPATDIRIEKCGGRADQKAGLKTAGWRFAVVRGTDEYLAAFMDRGDAEAFLAALKQSAPASA